MKIGYARVSTSDQNFRLQIDALKEAGCEKIFKEKISGAKANRIELERMLDELRPGDELVIWKLDRLGRSLQHLVSLVRDLIDLGISLKSLNDPIDTTSSQGKFIFNLFASLAEFFHETGKNYSFQSPVKINEELFLEIYKMGYKL